MNQVTNRTDVTYSINVWTVILYYKVSKEKQHRLTDNGRFIDRDALKLDLMVSDRPMLWNG